MDIKEFVEKAKPNRATAKKIMDVGGLTKEQYKYITEEIDKHIFSTYKDIEEFKDRLVYVSPMFVKILVELASDEELEFD
jgi:chemotaxis regulatin CheY-phosphate phosphatase CheZ